VPAPWAGEQAAWSADGRRLAFVTRRFDPAGDVYAMAATGAAVRPVARDPEVAEWGPTWRGDRVAFTTVAASADTDLWSADRGGADLRNLTSRPGREDSQPTFAADGSRLAYVSYTAGGVEVIVAEPDGRNPRVLRSGTFGQYESPTLSPDGRLLAVVDRGAGPDGGAAAAAVVPPNRIRVLRVLDGAEVGHLPVPAHLVGTEHDAAWSPDGGAIAVSRTSAARDTRVLPEQVEQELPPGRSVTVPTTVRTAGDPDSDLDVLVRPAVDCADGLTAAVEPPERLVRGDRDVTSAFAVTITRRTAAPTPSESPSEVPSEVPSEAPSEVPSEVPPQSSFAVEPTDEPAAGSLLSCTVSYTNQLVQDLLVQPVAAGQPYVQLDDVTAPDGGADGARVEFAPRAFDGTGTPIADVACDRRPGSAFPVGATYVTCTATDGQGRTARDRAVVAVTDGIESTHRVWVARIASATGDEVTFGDQLDLGARLRAPCRPGRTAGYPAWSPDGRALAFSQREADEDTEGAAWSALCVVDADGRNARLLVAPGAGGEADGPGDDDTAAQPAWTPDGSRIAYHDNGAIRTVPVTGGETAGVETVGRGRYPVYQRLPDRDLHLSMSVGGPGYVGGDPVPLTLTVRNDSPRPARNVWLSVALPAGVGDPPSIDSRCDARATLCRLVDLDEGDQVAVTMAVPAGDAYRGPLPARLNATVEGAPPADRQTSADLLVVHPELTVDPPIGRPGFVPRVDGANFPPGATVRVTWSTGITAEPDLVRVRPDGTFAVSRLVMREERPGLRRVHAEVVDGSPFAPVDSSEEFIVLPRVLAPPQLEYRKDPHDPRHR
ncbi:MAG TPA: hypothetical protein VES42_05545, partial [Pilimelia sp.]|nr:hypothetical protein [Pilimelia sp.]